MDKKKIEDSINKVLGEQNLYKIDPWKYPDKKCKHGNQVSCAKCFASIEKERKKILEESNIGETVNFEFKGYVKK